MQIQAILQKLLAQHDLEADEMRNVMTAMMSGELSDTQIAAFLIALRCKGESVTEIVTAVTVMRELAQTISLSGDHIIDTCGTGGDGANTFNISTVSAFVVSAAGGKVAKHGNRSVSSRSGSADLLELAGVNLDMDVLQVVACIEELGVGFLFAAKHHNAVRHTVNARKELGVRTLFNLIGPMTNPANALHQLIGVYDRKWLIPVAEVLRQLGSKHVLVVSAEDGLDEISIATVTHVAELKNGEIFSYTISPELFGLKTGKIEDLAVSNAQESLAIIIAILNGQKGSARDIVILNAGAAIYAADLCTSLAEGLKIAEQVIDNGLAKNKLNEFIRFSKNHS